MCWFSSNVKRVRLSEVYPEWKQALTGEHKSIWTRGVTAWQDYVYYRCVSQAFAEAAKTPAKDGLPYGLMNTYHQAFYRSLMVELRSAIGGDSDSLLNVRRGEYSIRAVLKSIAETTITRAHLFEANEVEYEYETKKALDEEEIRNALHKEGFGVIPSTYAGWRTSMSLHLTIDRLTGKSEGIRSPNDVIPPKIFLKAEKALKNRTEKLLIFVNKHIAHAATKESIEAESRTVPSRIHAEDIEETFGALIGTFDMLASDLFCWGGYSFRLDVSSKLEGVEKAFGLKPGEANLNRTYQEFSKKFDSELRKWRPV
jgi:hypothetical protein